MRSRFNTPANPSAAQRGVLAGLISASLIGVPARAQTNINFNVANGNWNNTGSWSPADVPNAIGDRAIFNGQTNAAGAATVNGAFTIAGVYFGSSSGNYTLQSGGTGRILTLANATATIGGIQSDSTKDQLITGAQLRILIAAPTAFRVGGVGNLTITPTGGTIVTTTANVITLNGAGTGIGLLGSVISGTGNVTKADSSTWILSGINTFTGNTIITGGTLSVSANANLGGTPGAFNATSIQLSGGTLKATETFTLAANRGITLGAATTSSIVASNTKTLTVGGAIAGSGNVVYGSASDAGNIVLSATSTYTGTSRIASGVVSVSSDQNLGAAPAALTPDSLTLAGGALLGTATFTLAGNRGITLETGTSSSLAADATRNLAVGGVIAGSGNITFGTGTATGNVVLNALSTYTGTTTIDKGTVRVGVDNALPTATRVTVSSAATLDLVSANVTIGALTGVAGSAVDLSGASITRTLTIGDATSTTFAGTIGDSGAASVLNLVKQGTGTLTLSGTNTFAGTANVTAGTLNLQNASAVGTGAGNVTVSSGATLALEHASGFTTGSGRTLSLAGTGAATGALVNVSGVNSWAGNVTLNGDTTIAATAGELKLGTFGSYVDRTTNAAGTAPSVNTLDPNRIYLNGSTLTFSGAGNTTVHGRIDNDVAQTAGGNVIIDKTAGIVQLVNNQNNYTGNTTVKGGTLLVDTLNNSFPTDTNWAQFYGLKSNAAQTNSLTIGDGIGAAQSAIVQLGQNVSPIANEVLDFRLRVNINSDGYFNLNNQAQTIGPLQMTGGRINAGSTGTLFLNGDVTVNSHTSTAVIDGGGLGLSAHNAVSFANRVFNVGRNSANNASDATSSGDLLVNAKISYGSITKNGTGTMQVTSNNSFGYSGSTTINDGVLRITHGNALGQGDNDPTTSYTRVNSGGSLQLRDNITVASEYLYLNGQGYNGGGALQNAGGNNTFSGLITLENAARINASAGNLTITSTLSSLSNYQLDVGGSGNVTHTGTLALGSGNLNKDGSGTFTFAGGSGVAGQTHLGAGTMIVGTGAATTLTTGEFSSATSTTLTIASGGTVSSVFDNGAITQFSGVLGATSAGTLALSSAAGTSSGLQFNASFTATNLTLKLGGATTGSTDLSNYFRLELANVQLTVGTIHITGDTILDFNNSAGTFLSSANLIIDPGVKISVQNWVSVANAPGLSTVWYATNTTGGVSGGSNSLNLTSGTVYGAAPLNQIQFTSYSGVTTTWVSGTSSGWFDREIRPTPEPSTYGAILLGSCCSLLGWRRWRQRRAVASR